MPHLVRALHSGNGMWMTQRGFQEMQNLLAYCFIGSTIRREMNIVLD